RGSGGRKSGIAEERRPCPLLSEGVPPLRPPRVDEDSLHLIDAPTPCPPATDHEPRPVGLQSRFRAERARATGIQCRSTRPPEPMKPVSIPTSEDCHGFFRPRSRRAPL